MWLKVATVGRRSLEIATESRVAGDRNRGLRCWRSQQKVASQQWVAGDVAAEDRWRSRVAGDVASLELLRRVAWLVMSQQKRSRSVGDVAAEDRVAGGRGPC